MTTCTPINRVDDTASGTSSSALGGGGGGDDSCKKPNRNNEGPLGHKDNTNDFDITTAGLIATFVDLLYIRQYMRSALISSTINPGTLGTHGGVFADQHNRRLHLINELD